MNCTETQTAQDGDGRPRTSTVIELGSQTAQDGDGRPRTSTVIELESQLRCVSSGYLSGGCSCRETVPAAVVDAAWAREVAHVGSAEDRFFHFACEGEVWLALGMADGEIRGVYCPTHRAERDARARGGKAATPAAVAA
jgi:hypothetical protein